MDAETRAAIDACVRSLEELEVLLFLARDRRRYSSADTIAAEIALAVPPVAAALEALAARNLLDVRIAEAVLYRLDPASAATGACVERTLEAAWRDRMAVLKTILGGRSAARDFAEAFRVTRKRSSDG